MRRISLPKGYGDGSITGGWGDELGNGYGEGSDAFIQPCNWGTGDGGGHSALKLGAGSGRDFRTGDGRAYRFGLETDDYPHNLVII